jgi:hypothetical protein
MNIFGTNTLLHIKLCGKTDIELFTADSVIPNSMTMKKGIRQISKYQDYVDGNKDHTQA